MPAAADVVFVVRLLQHLGDERVAVDRLEEAVDVDASPLARKGDVLLGAERLVAEEDHSVGVECVANLGELLRVDIGRQIGSEDLRSDHPRQGLHFDGAVGVAGFHVIAPVASSIACGHGTLDQTGGRRHAPEVEWRSARCRMQVADSRCSSQMNQSHRGALRDSGEAGMSGAARRRCRLDVLHEVGSA